MCILFVDDEFIITMVAEDALRDAGHEVMTATDAAEGIQFIKAHPGHFSCLVTDIHMPGELTGFDLAEHAHQTYPCLPILVATGRPDVVTPKWRNQHRAALLAKPYTPSLLIAVIERLLRGAGVLRSAR